MIRGIFFALIFLLPAYVSAQAIPIPGVTQTPAIILSPEYPAPFESVTATVRIGSEDLSSADIAWILDGTPVAEGVGRISFSFRAGDIGAIQALSVLVRTPNGNAEAVQARVNPTRIHVAWEAQTYTPLLYKGRSLYSAGSGIVAEAHVQYIDDSGAIVAPENLIYFWRRNGSAIAGANGRGKYVLRTEGPKFYGTDILSVQVSTPQGIVVGTGAARIDTIDPRLVLYTWSPVTGPAYSAAIAQTEGSIGNATTIVAEPYFMGATSSKSPLLLYEWLVNGRALSVQESSPNFLSLSSEDATSAVISLSVTHKTALLQEAKRKWQLQFKESGFGLFGR